MLRQAVFDRIRLSNLEQNLGLYVSIYIAMERKLPFSSAAMTE